MKQQNPNFEPETSRGHRNVAKNESSPAMTLQRRPCSLFGALLLSLPVAQTEAGIVNDGSRLAQNTPPVPILARVASVRERLGLVGERDPRLKAAQDAALRLSQWPDWSDWYNR